jgi:hypothetical protein
MRYVLYYVSVFLLIALSSLSHAQAQAHSPSTYSGLSAEQKLMWQRILLQDDAYFRPQNPEYYLGHTVTPDMATEFKLAEQYLRGTLPVTGAADKAPWCQFPARFAFVAKVIYGGYFMPEAFRACNLPLPEVNETLKVEIVKMLHRADSGEALFHVGLFVRGKRFYNGSVLTMNIGFGRNADHHTEFSNNVALLKDGFRLARAFYGNGEVIIKFDDSPNRIDRNKDGQQLYRINLPPEKIYLMVLLAYETKHAKLPYNLLRANCHSYLEHILRAVLPDQGSHKEHFFDFMPAFMEKNNTAMRQIFVSEGYWSPSTQVLDKMERALDWHEYQQLQAFLKDGIVPAAQDLNASRRLRLAVGKAAEQREDVLKISPDAVALRDEYLSSEMSAPIKHTIIPKIEDGENIVPLFNINNAHSSAFEVGALSMDGKTRLRLEMDVFSTMADRLQAATPYGFTMGKLAVQASDDGVALDHFLFAQERRVGAGCCGEKLYELGVRNISDVSIDIVNNPTKLDQEAWKLKPDIELNFAKGIGTVSRNGWSWQVLPNVSVLTYGEWIDLTVKAGVGWTNEKWAVSASQLGRIYGPDGRRSMPDEALTAEYKLSRDARLEVNYKHYDTLGTIAGVGYAFAF